MKSLIDSTSIITNVGKEHFLIFLIALICSILVIDNISINILTIQVRFLEVIRRVPNIIKLQRLLISWYQDKLERSDNLSIEEAIKEGKLTFFTYLNVLMKQILICIYMPKSLIHLKR